MGRKTIGNAVLEIEQKRTKERHTLRTPGVPRDRGVEKLAWGAQKRYYKLHQKKTPTSLSRPSGNAVQRVGETQRTGVLYAFGVNWAILFLKGIVEVPYF